MREEQQQQSLSYFGEFAAEWRQKAEGTFSKSVNVIEQRNGFVLTVAEERPSVGRSLDVGCGTGELCVALAAKGVDAVGLDFAAEMIQLCNQKKAALGAEKATFVHGSIFEFSPDRPFDLISANGFIEYISPSQLDQFLTFSRANLSGGGSFVLGSRNRLFNAFTLNEYTQIERTLGALPQLIDESLEIATSETMEACLKVLTSRATALPSVESHPSTGIHVATRYQFTPAELVNRLRRFGLKTVEIYPIHYHGAVPRFRSAHPEAHVAISTLVQAHGRRTPYLLPYASSFMLHAVAD